jgi:hypothetical protein
VDLRPASSLLAAATTALAQSAALASSVRRAGSAADLRPDGATGAALPVPRHTARHTPSAARKAYHLVL